MTPTDCTASIYGLLRHSAIANSFVGDNICVRYKLPFRINAWGYAIVRRHRALAHIEIQIEYES